VTTSSDDPLGNTERPVRAFQLGPDRKSKEKRKMKYVQVEIVPIFDDGPVYCKTIVYDLVVRDKAIAERTVRDIFHCDELTHSVDVLKSAIIS
jgi:hypothetical protein